MSFCVECRLRINPQRQCEQSPGNLSNWTIFLDPKQCYCFIPTAVFGAKEKPRISLINELNPDQEHAIEEHVILESGIDKGCPYLTISSRDQSISSATMVLCQNFVWFRRSYDVDDDANGFYVQNRINSGIPVRYCHAEYPSTFHLQCNQDDNSLMFSADGKVVAMCKFEVPTHQVNLANISATGQFTSPWRATLNLTSPGAAWGIYGTQEGTKLAATGNELCPHGGVPDSVRILASAARFLPVSFHVSLVLSEQSIEVLVEGSNASKPKEGNYSLHTTSALKQQWYVSTATGQRAALTYTCEDSKAVFFAAKHARPSNNPPVPPTQWTAVEIVLKQQRPLWSVHQCVTFSVYSNYKFDVLPHPGTFSRCLLVLIPQNQILALENLITTDLPVSFYVENNESPFFSGTLDHKATKFFLDLKRHLPALDRAAFPRCIPEFECNFSSAEGERAVASGIICTDIANEKWLNRYRDACRQLAACIHRPNFSHMLKTRLATDRRSSAVQFTIVAAKVQYVQSQNNVLPRPRIRQAQHSAIVVPVSQPQQPQPPSARDQLVDELWAVLLPAMQGTLRMDQLCDGLKVVLGSRSLHTSNTGSSDLAPASSAAVGAAAAAAGVSYLAVVASFLQTVLSECLHLWRSLVRGFQAGLLQLQEHGRNLRRLSFPKWLGMSTIGQAVVLGYSVFICFQRDDQDENFQLALALMLVGFLILINALQ